MAEATDLSRHPRFAIVGCGKMGEAALSGWLSCKDGAASDMVAGDFVAVAPSKETRMRISDIYGVETVDAAGKLADIDVFVLAVKPQVMPSVLDELALSEVVQDKLIITMAAGIPTSTYERALPDARVVRVMPNMPLQVGMGASVVAGGASAHAADVELARDLFAALGMAEIVDESQIDAVCAISGGGPAYVAYMIEALRDAGVEAGLSRDLAEALATQTVGGTWKAMSDDDISPEAMRTSVCSPGGTTLAALAAMDDAGFKEMFASAVDAAVARAKELAG